LPKYNQKFVRKAKVEQSAYRAIPTGMDLDLIFCRKEKRQVQGDNTISYQGRRYQILPTETRFGFAKARVEVHRCLDGSIHIFLNGSFAGRGMTFLFCRKYDIITVHSQDCG